MPSRACQIATKVRMDVGGPLTVDAKRTATLAHACCEGTDCDCLCHAAAIEMTGYGNDPLPVLTHYPAGATPLPA